MIDPRELHDLQQRYLALWFGYSLTLTQLAVIACFWPAPVVRAMSDLCWCIHFGMRPQREPRRERGHLRLVAAA